MYIKFESGWLKKQFEDVEKKLSQYPDWMKEEAGFDKNYDKSIFCTESESNSSSLKEE